VKDEVDDASSHKLSRDFRYPSRWEDIPAWVDSLPRIYPHSTPDICTQHVIKIMHQLVNPVEMESTPIIPEVPISLKREYPDEDEPDHAGGDIKRSRGRPRGSLGKQNQSLLTDFIS
jgi:hypothetical protein